MSNKDSLAGHHSRPIQVSPFQVFSKYDQNKFTGRINLNWLRTHHVLSLLENIRFPYTNGNPGVESSKNRSRSGILKVHFTHRNPYTYHVNISHESCEMLILSQNRQRLKL